MSEVRSGTNKKAWLKKKDTPKNEVSYMGSERIELAYYRKSVKKQAATAGCFRIVR